MAREKTQVPETRPCTARPKQAKKPKYPRIDHRTEKHARVDFELSCLDKEVTFSDLDDDINIADMFAEKIEDELIARMDGDVADEDAVLELRDRRLEFLKWAMNQMSEKQALALGLWFHGASQTYGAAVLGITQPSFREALFGKDGKGGAIKKLRKLAAKYPITHS